MAVTPTAKWVAGVLNAPGAALIKPRGSAVYTPEIEQWLIENGYAVSDVDSGVTLTEEPKQESKQESKTNETKQNKKKKKSTVKARGASLERSEEHEEEHEEDTEDDDETGDSNEIGEDSEDNLERD